MGCCPARSWQTEFFRSLPHSESYWLCVTAVDTFSGYVLLFQSNQVTPATLLQPLKVICVKCLAFWTIWYDNGIIPFTAKATQPWADSQSI